MCVCLCVCVCVCDWTVRFQRKEGRRGEDEIEDISGDRSVSVHAQPSTEIQGIL